MLTHVLHFYSAELAATRYQSAATAFRAKQSSRESSTDPCEQQVPDCQFKPYALVVDDASDIAFMLVIILEQAGYDAIMALSGTEALVLAKREQFDLVISDIAMPEMDGYSLARALRSLPNYRSVPLIAVTGFAEYDDRDRALDAGFNTHVKKPIDPASFIEVLRALRS